MKNMANGIFLFYFLIVSGIAHGQEVYTGIGDRRDIAVTIYSGGIALVKDVREIQIPSGESLIFFQDVSEKIMAETAFLQPVDKLPLGVVEQTFHFDLITPEKLVEEYIGKNVSAITTHPTTGEETESEARIVSANNGLVLEMNGKIETNFPGRLVFPGLPSQLSDKPALSILCNTVASGDRHVELSYLTGGLSWKTDYVAELTHDDGEIDLNCRATLSNSSGVSYDSARVQLVAGDVQGGVVPDQKRAFRGQEAMTMMAAAAPDVVREEVFEYHVYSLNRSTDIKENQTKQVTLLEAENVPCKREYVLDGREHYFRGRYGGGDQSEKVSVFVTFLNKKENNLGDPLPGGTIRVYKKDSKGNAVFVGEDRIDHTPENEKVRLRLGRAFDITAERKQTDFSKVKGFAKYNYVFESAFHITIKNSKDEDVIVKVREPLPGDWEILEENLPHEKKPARLLSGM